MKFFFARIRDDHTRARLAGNGFLVRAEKRTERDLLFLQCRAPALGLQLVVTVCFDFKIVSQDLRESGNYTYARKVPVQLEMEKAFSQ